VRRDPAVVLQLNLAERGVAAAAAIVAGQSGYGRSLHARKQIWQSTGYAVSRGAMGYPGLKWGMLVRTDEREALATARALRAQLIAMLGGVIVALAFVAWVLSGLVARPILAGLGALRAGTLQVTSAAGQASASSQALSQGATEQAASIHETSASMAQLSTTTRHNADNSHAAAALTADVDGRVERSRRALDSMIVSMSAIQQSSQKVGKIIKTIDEIAFQTNILALNAAVEAARAGEAGMGFAVVADEVRNLAHRAAQAAQETEALIEESIATAQAGTAEVTQVSTMIVEIKEGVARVKALMDDVTSASREQAQSIDQVSSAVAQMDSVTQTTSATTEETAALSEELSAQANQSMTIVSGLQVLVAGTRVPAVRKGAPNAAPSRSGAAARTGHRIGVPRSAAAAPEDILPLGDTGTFGSF